MVSAAEAMECLMVTAASCKSNTNLFIHLIYKNLFTIKNLRFIYYNMFSYPITMFEQYPSVEEYYTQYGTKRWLKERGFGTLETG